MKSRRSRVKKLSRVRALKGKAASALPPEIESSPVEKAEGERTFPVVGIGASAGGLAAATDLLKHIPSDTPVAIVIVQHLDPRHGSLTPEILGRASSMPVAEVTEGMRVQPHHAYVIPPNASLRISGGVLKLLPRSDGRGRHLPIDLFFQSLAEDQKDLAIGVVLSGIASDGTLGVQAIKAEGGFTFAQDPMTAQYDGMPRSAIASGAVDTVETPEGIARGIVKMSSSLSSAPGRLARTVRPPPAGHVPNGNRRILASIRTATGADFTHYKQTTIQRRIARRLLLLKIDDTQTYASYLEAHPEEVQALFSDVLIHVTGFFRDRDAYENLKDRLLPKLAESWDPNVPFRVWVPGCSTGEEVYSIAIAFFEFLEKARGKGRPTLQILASDISEPSLQRARSGLYPDTIAKDVSKARLGRFFERAEGGYRIVKSIRDCCLFSRHDVTVDPPFAKVDLISCRNVLIYFASELQKRVVPILHYALNPGGILWLGRSETISGFGHLFSLEDKAHKFYSKKTSATPLKVHFPVVRYPHGPIDARKSVSPATTTVQEVQLEADRVAVREYAPPGVVINDSLEILQVRGRPAPYLELTPGQASLNLLKLAHPEIVSDLRYLINLARTKDSAATRDGLTLKRKDGERTKRFAIRVVPIHLALRNKERYFSIFFEESGSAERVPPSPTVRGRRKKSGPESTKLPQAQEDWKYQQALIEEYETTQEELIASNEELQSTNEELQSTNEELETAKEELQSANEEMTTINDELQTRNQETSLLSNDLTNLLGSVDLAIVMVGPDTKIRRFTPKASQVLNLIAADLGRPISDINTGIQGPDLEDIVAEVGSSLTMKEFEAQDKQGGWYRVQVRPYRTSDNRIDGAVIALADITALKQAVSELQAAHADATNIVETIPAPILVITPDRRIQSANDAFYSMFRVGVAETEGKLLAEFCDGCWNVPSVLANVDSVLTEGTAFHDLAVEVDFPLVGHRSMILHATATRLTGAGKNTALLAIEDVTDRTRIEAERLQLLSSETEARREAERANQIKDEFLATLSHELRTPLSTILSWAHLLRLGADADKTATAIAAIEKSAHAQTQLIEDLLDTSRIRAGKLRLDVRDIEPTNCIVSAIESVRTLAQARSITVRAESDPAACVIPADPMRIEQVLRNLLTNAIKFTLPGGRITVRSKQQHDPDRLDIEVHDTGKGIRPEFLPKLFTRFSQEDPSTQREFGGLGLGLSIVKNLVELHGGTVKAESFGEGKGSVFTVTLPCATPRRASATASEAPRDTRRSLGHPDDLNGVRVLLIDDHDDTRAVVSEIVRSFGAQVQTADSVAEGMSTFVRFRPDAVLCDIAMPGEDGYSFIRRIRALKLDEGGTTPVAALSAYAGSEVVQRALEAGFDLHLSKPISAMNLSNALVSLVASKRKRA